MEGNHEEISDFLHFGVWREVIYCGLTSRLYSTLKVDMPGAEDLNRDSKMDAALGWCCCLEAIDGEREPVPWNSVFYKDKTRIIKADDE